MNISDWLEGLGLAEYETAFRENAVDQDVLFDLTADDLKEIGVAAVGHRRRILAAIARLKETTSDVSSNTVARQVPGERRHVAILFADLVGYTRLTEELGAEAMHKILHGYFSRADAIIERLGGRVDKHIGDCVMGVFGAPIAHGNDAERAIRAALEIRSEIRLLSDETGRDLDVHVGVTTGVVVASYVGSGQAAEYAVTGESVNLASRLTDAAGAGELLIADDLHRMLEGRLVSEAAGTLDIKNFETPVRAWRVLGLQDDHVASGPFVGRRAEMRQFASILHACSEDGFGHVVVLRGEAGIGKTRLSNEFERMAKEESFLCHRGLVLDFGGETGRDAIRAIIRDLLDVDPRSGIDELLSAARSAVTSGIVREDLEPHLNDLLYAPQPEHLRTVYDAMDNERHQQGRGETISAILAWATELHPRLLLVEDVHWARPPLLRALAQMAQAIADRRAILVITSRVESDPLDRSWRANTAGVPFITVDLSPLRVDDARAICELLINDPDTIDRLVSRAGGNPLFLEQLLHHSQESDVDVVPGSIQSFVQSTVDQLASDDKKAVQAASVIGQRVDPDLLRYLTEGVRLRLPELVERNLLRPEGEEYLFVHALIRDAVYASLLTPTRKALHLRAADWFNERDRKLNAEHLALAGAPEAAAAFLAAAREEIAKYHYETALALIERGLSTTEDPQDIVVLRLLEGEAWHDFGRMAEAERTFASALEVAIAPADRSRALIGIAGVKRVTDEIDSAFIDLDRAEEAAVADGLIVERARIHFLRGNLLFPKGDLEGCYHQHKEGLRFARLAKCSHLEAAALGGLGDAEYVRGRMASARGRLEECVQIAGQQGLGRIVVANQAQVAHAMLYTGSQLAAYEAACAAVEAAARVGHTRAEINAGLVVFMALFLMARYDECLEQVSRVEHCIDRLGAFRFKQATLLYNGRALLALGRTSEAITVLEKGIELARSTGFAFHGPSITGALAAAVEDRERKIDLIDRAVASCAAGCVGHNQLHVYPFGIDVAYEIQDPAMLGHYIELVANYPKDEQLVWTEFQAMRGRVLLARLERGDTPKVQAAYQAAILRSKELSIRYWIAE